MIRLKNGFLLQIHQSLEIHNLIKLEITQKRDFLQNPTSMSPLTSYFYENSKGLSQGSYNSMFVGFNTPKGTGVKVFYFTPVPEPVRPKGWLPI